MGWGAFYNSTKSVVSKAKNYVASGFSWGAWKNGGANDTPGEKNLADESKLADESQLAVESGVADETKIAREPGATGKTSGGTGVG